jgi:nucleoside 2-deoxyribosyltransferase
MAHPLEARKTVREFELEIEKRTGIELVNPFYDRERDDIIDIDNGKTTRWQIPAAPVVEADIAAIRECDAFLAILTDKLSIGTPMEIVYAYLAKKPIYILDFNEVGKHPWIRYHATTVVSSWDELEMVLNLDNR